jgi:hypothetical protein
MRVTQYAEVPKSWLVETSVDCQHCAEVDHDESDRRPQRWNATTAFTVASSRPFRFIRLANIGQNDRGNDVLKLTASQIFGTLIGQKKIINTILSHAPITKSAAKPFLRSNALVEWVFAKRVW